MSMIDLNLTIKGEITIEGVYNGKIDVCITNVDIDDLISEVGIGKLIEYMDRDEIVSELESLGYSVSTD